MFAFDPETFSGRAPLFPLPDTVLVPWTPQAFHVFEPRYRAMLRDALAGEGLIAVPLLAPGWESDYRGCPPIHAVCGLGCIQQHRGYPDGKGDILLMGAARVRVESEDRSRSYRVASVRVLEDSYPAGIDLSGERDALLRHAGLAEDATLARLTAGQVADVLLGLMVLPPEEKQRILELLDVPQRMRAVGAWLERIGRGDPASN